MQTFTKLKKFVWFWLVGLLLLFPSATVAHPLDEFYQVTYITIVPNRITLQIELYTGVLIAPKILGMIDTNQDDRISEAESQAYVDLFLKDIIFEIDGQSFPLSTSNLEFPTPLDLKAGVGVVRFSLYTNLPPDHRGSHYFFYKNNHQPNISVYLVNTLGDAARWVKISKQDKDIFQASVRAEYTINPDAPIDFGEVGILTKIEVPGGVTKGQEQLTRYLYDPNLSLLFLLIALGLSAVLGGLHALTPGHGKTVLAAYLIGSRGTVGHAVVLGGIMTFTHTASVIVIGLLALLASQFIVPNMLVPSLEILSGLLVVYMGSRLVWARWKALSKEDHHHPDHSHDHSHNHDHHHTLPESVKMSDLLTLGISGGLLPCPEALGIMLIAIGLNRVLLGLGLIVTFSFGLAAVLIIIGIMLVRSKVLLDRLSNVRGLAHWQTLLPLVSAVIVTVLGLGIIAKSLIPYLAR